MPATPAAAASWRTPAAPSAWPSPAPAICWPPQRVVVGRELARAGDLLLDPLRACVRRSAIAASREVPVLAGVLGERAEGLGAVPLVVRASQRFVAAPALV
jgi:hypothetical protein